MPTERRGDQLGAVAGIVSVLLHFASGRLQEVAVTQTADPGPAFATSLLARPALFAFAMYLMGLGGLSFLWFCWTLRRLFRRVEPEPGRLADLSLVSGTGWAGLLILASVLGANAPVLAAYYQQPEAARFVVALELPRVPLGLLLQGLWAGATGLAGLRLRLFPRWLAWAGAALGALLVLAATIQPLADPTASRATPEVGPVTAFSGFLSFALFFLWVLAASVMLVRQRPGAPSP